MKLIRKYYKDILACLIFFLILYLFYKSFLVLILIPPFFYFYRKYSKKEALYNYREKLNIQFKDMLVSLTAALRAGYSVENGLAEAYKEMKIMYGEMAPISLEIKTMLNQISLGVTAEKVFTDFAERSGVEDIFTFAAVFKIAKNSGGDMVEILKKTASDISAKVETKKEISVMISSKKFEQMIMNLMPIGIILYVSLTSDGLLDPLYGNVTGVVIMTLCLGVYAAAFLISKKIMKIEI